MVEYRNVSSQNGGDTDQKAKVKRLQWISSVILDQPHELSRPLGSHLCKAVYHVLSMHHVPASVGNSLDVRPSSDVDLRYSLLPSSLHHQA